MQLNRFINMSLTVYARMTTGEEIRRQKRLKVDVINESVIDGLIQRRQELEAQQAHTIKSLVLSVFLSFVAWQGGNIKIPTTGASISEVPAFLEISLVVSSLLIMWLPYAFLNIQIYDGVIQSILKEKTETCGIDEDIVAASKMPTQLFIKYTKSPVTIGREDGYKISKYGKIYNSLLLGLVVFSFFLCFVFFLVSVLVIAHIGLGNGFIGWSVYLICWFVVSVGVYAITANFIESQYEMDFDLLEAIVTTTDEKS